MVGVSLPGAGMRRWFCGWVFSVGKLLIFHIEKIEGLKISNKKAQERTP